MASQFKHTTDLEFSSRAIQPTFPAPINTTLKKSLTAPGNPAKYKYEILDEAGEPVATRESNRDFVAAIAVPCMVRDVLGQEAPRLYMDSYFFYLESYIGQGDSESYFKTNRVKYLAKHDGKIYPAPVEPGQEVKAMAAPAPPVLERAAKKTKKELAKTEPPVLQTSLF